MTLPNRLTGNMIEQFKQSDLLCVDSETKDPKLTTEGPGTHRGDGHISGVGLATVDRGELVREYLSVAHPDTPENIREKNRRILKDILRVDKPKIGANIMYDVEWLNHEGCQVNGKLHDVQFAEPLLNEYKRSYSLDNLAKSYLLGRKATDVLANYNKTMGWKGKPITNIWRMPEGVAREYCFTDIRLPLEIFKKQKRNLETQNLYSLYEMETDLIPVLLEMRRNGVRLDMPLMKKTAVRVTELHFQLKQKLFKWAGYELNLNSPSQIAKVFDRVGIVYPRNPVTAAMEAKGITIGTPNLDKKALQRLATTYPICNDILNYRHYETLISLFLNKYANLCVGDHLYCSFHPLRNDNYGTVSGRLSSSKPNLQQVTAKKENFNSDDRLDVLTGKIIRKLFIPEEGYDEWVRLDYSQVEYRILAHYASGGGAEELRQSYLNDKKMDYHQRVMDLAGLERGPAKTLNFGCMYGMGVPTTAKELGCPIEDAELFSNSYHKAAPYIKHTKDAVTKKISRRGFVFTLLGRKARLHPSRKLHSFFCRLIQGTGADIMKKAMVDAHKKGLFDTLKLHITLHDELGVSRKNNPEAKEATKELQHTMEQAVKLSVPLLVPFKAGANWAEAD